MDISTETVYQIVRVLFALSLLGFLLFVIRSSMQDLHRPTVTGIRTGSHRQRAELLSIPGEDDSMVPGGLVFEISGATTIGRARNSRIVLDDSSVSAHHALLRPVEGAWIIEDLESRNGTLVNGRRIQEPATLACGDSLQFGRVRLRLMC